MTNIASSAWLIYTQDVDTVQLEIYYIDIKRHFKAEIIS